MRKARDDVELIAARAEVEEATTKADDARKVWLQMATEKSSDLPQVDRDAYLAKIRLKADTMVEFFNSVKSKVCASSDGKLSSVAVADLLRKAETETKELCDNLIVEEFGGQFEDITSTCVEAVKSEISNLVRKAMGGLDALIAKVAKKLEENTKKLRDAVDTVGSYNENADVAITVGQGIVYVIRFHHPTHTCASL